MVEAGTGVWAGNGWNLAARAHAGGNQATFYNQGGSLIPTTDQDNSADIRGAVQLNSYDFGKATATASALLLAETPSPTELVGMAIVVAGMLVAFRSPSTG